jgi:GNAT superfamily N-acetyltransferase
LPITLVPASSPHAVGDAEIRARLNSSPKGRYTRQYVALEDDNERAFVALDFEPDQLVLYELWVPRANRRLGVGTQVLKTVDVLAGDAGYSAVIVRPEPIDPAISRDSLVSFYRRNGFEPVATDNALMTKRLGA